MATFERTDEGFARAMESIKFMCRWGNHDRGVYMFVEARNPTEYTVSAIEPRLDEIAEGTAITYHSKEQFDEDAEADRQWQELQDGAAVGMDLAS